MQTTITIGYDQVFELARQLSPGERERLAKEIVLPETRPVRSEPEPRQDLTVLEKGEGFAVVQIPFPDTEEGRTQQKELEQLQRETRKTYPEIFGHPKCSREQWKQILSNVPILSSEDAEKLEKSMKNFRKEFNDAFECRRLGLVGPD